MTSYYEIQLEKHKNAHISWSGIIKFQEENIIDFPPKHIEMVKINGNRLYHYFIKRSIHFKFYGKRAQNGLYILKIEEGYIPTTIFKKEIFLLKKFSEQETKQNLHKFLLKLKENKKIGKLNEMRKKLIIALINDIIKNISQNQIKRDENIKKLKHILNNITTDILVYNLHFLPFDKTNLKYYLSKDKIYTLYINEKTQLKKKGRPKKINKIFNNPTFFNWKTQKIDPITLNIDLLSVLFKETIKIVEKYLDTEEILTTFLPEPNIIKTIYLNNQQNFSNISLGILRKIQKNRGILNDLFEYSSKIKKERINITKNINAFLSFYNEKLEKELKEEMK